MIPIIKLLQNESLRLASQLVKTSSFLFGKGKRVRDLSQVKITLQPQSLGQVTVAQKVDYVAMREQLRQLNWQEMQFDKLCALPEQTLALISMQAKKDKFNVDDKEFYNYSIKELHIKQQNNAVVMSKLNPYYQRLYHLIMNNHQQYDQLAKSTYGKTYYQAQMYIMDLQKNIKLKNVIEYFVNNINHPNKLEVVAQPSFIKRLLSIKRQLMMQGIHFDNLQEEKLKKKIAKKKTQKNLIKNDEYMEEDDEVNELANEDIQNAQFQLQKEQELQKDGTNFDSFLNESLKQSKYKVKIVKVLGYQYEFWVDVKHNRSKNGVEEDYIIEQRLIDNPNESILVKQQYPKIKVRYIVHKKKRKDYSMHFCIKANLIVDVSGSRKNVKVQWKGPSNNSKDNQKQVSFIITDYQFLMNGNPTIKPIFFF